MRILLLGEYSNVHATLASGLRELGHEVVVASNGDFWKNYPRDIDLSRPKGPFAGFRLWMKVMRNLSKFKNFDIVQIINPLFLDLKAKQHYRIIDFLIRNNHRLILCAFGMDYYWVSQSEKGIFRYGDFNIGEKKRTDQAAESLRKEWIGTDKEQLSRYCAEKADFIVTGLYEYDACYRPLFPDKTVYIPFPIKLSSEKSPEFENNRKIRLFIGISKSRSTYKGTDIMLKAAEAIRDKYPERVDLKIVEGIPFNEYRRIILHSDILLDQLYSYTPAMNALEAMSHGIVCVGGGEPENYDILGEKELRPIINVAPNYQSVYDELENIVLHPEIIPDLKHQSVEYITRHHEYIKVARQYQSLYANILAI